MNTTEVRRRTAEIASHLAAIRDLARSIQTRHPQGAALYRALNAGCLPAEDADPVELVERVLQRHELPAGQQEERHARFR